MDKITYQVRAEHWVKIINECINSGMSKTAWCRTNCFLQTFFGQSCKPHYWTKLQKSYWGLHPQTPVKLGVW